MALRTKVGSFVGQNDTNNQSITGVGFKPKALFLWYDHSTADGDATNAQLGLGMAVSATQRAAIWSISDDAEATSDSLRRQTNLKCISACLVDTTLVAEADFVSFDGDGFTIDWTTASATVYNYLAIGGDDLTHAFLKEITTPASTGAQASTGVGFKPDCIIFMCCFNGATLPVNNAVARLSLGFASGPGAQGCIGSEQRDGTAAADTFYAHTTTEIIRQPTAAFTPLGADLTSFDADGFTLDWNAAEANNIVFALCLKGGKFKVGEIAQPTAAGAQTTGGIGFKPSALLLFSANNATDSLVAAEMKFSVGAASSPANQSSIVMADKDAADPMQTDRRMSRTKIISMLTAGTPTLDADAALASFGPGSFTLNWTNADATARLLMYLAMGGREAPIGVKRVMRRW